jgi:hypothetical protein
MKAGDIVFVRGNSIISKIVMLFDKGKFSHVAIAVSDTEILEADWYTRTRITGFHFDDYEIVSLDLSDEERELIPHASISVVGKHYDYLQIMWYVLKTMFSIKGKNRFNSPNNLICSEVIFYILSEIGRVDLAIGISPDVTPNELYKIFKESGRK